MIRHWPTKSPHKLNIASLLKNKILKKRKRGKNIYIINNNNNKIPRNAIRIQHGPFLPLVARLPAST